jgi:predicted nucleic acid-binding protein
VTVFVDTAVIMYAGGGEHPLRDPCGRIILGIADGEIDAVTSTEVIQEILHRFMSVRRPETGRAQAIEALDVFAPVLPITHALMRRVPDLAVAYPTLAARDLVHVATCIHEGISEIVSPDRGFDAVNEVRRIDPAVLGAEPA